MSQQEWLSPDVASEPERGHCLGLWDILCDARKSIWGLHKTYLGMLRGRTKGKEGEGIHVSPQCMCLHMPLCEGV